MSTITSLSPAEKFLCAYTSCTHMTSIDTKFFDYVTDLYNNLSINEQEEHRHNYNYISNQHKLHEALVLHSSLECRISQDKTFQPPEIDYHMKVLLTVSTKAEKNICSTLIDARKHESTLSQVKLFLLYGLPKNGTSVVLHNTFNSFQKYLQTKGCALLHLKENAFLWSSTDKYQINTKLNQLVSYLKCIIDTQSTTWIMLEIEQFQVLEGANVNVDRFLKQLLAMDRVILFAKTHKPSACDVPFRANALQSSFHFIELPSQEEIGSLLKMEICSRIKNGKTLPINNASSPYVEIAKEFQSLLTDEIAPQLTCDKAQQPTLKKSVREKCSTSAAKTKHGFTMYYVSSFLIPRFIKCLERAHTNWYHTDGQCIVKLPHKTEEKCPSVNKTDLIPLQKIIYNEGKLTRNEVIQLHKGLLSCDVTLTECPPAVQRVVDWKWIKEAKQTVFDIARQTLTDVAVVKVETPEKTWVNEQDILYEELLKFYEEN